MSKFQLIRGPGENSFCGPAALSILTGESVTTCVETVKRCFPGRRRIRGMYNHEMLKVLEVLGYSTERLSLINAFIDTNIRPTLARALKQVLQGRQRDEMFLINVTGHYITLRGNRIVDNCHPDGVFIRQYLKRRSRVKHIWQVIPKEPALGAPRTIAAIPPIPAIPPIQPIRLSWEGSKRDRLIASLRSGADLDTLMEVSGWQAHSVRGFLCTLRKTVKVKREKVGGVSVYKLD